MKSKFTALYIVGFALLIGTVMALAQSERQAVRGNGLLKDSAGKAKAEGKGEIIIRAPLYRPAGEVAPRPLKA